MMKLKSILRSCYELCFYKNTKYKLRREIGLTLFLKIVLLCMLSWICCKQVNTNILTSSQWFLGASSS